MALDAGWELVDQRGPGMRCATCEQRVAELAAHRRAQSSPPENRNWWRTRRRLAAARERIAELEAERALRGPVVSRKLSLGSFSERGARLRSCLWSVLASLYRWRWMQVYLHRCAELGGATAAMRWMLWGLDPPPRHALAVPGQPPGAVP